MTRGTLEIPLGLFLALPQLGEEFMCQLRVRVVKLEDELVDVTKLGDKLTQVLPSQGRATMVVISFVRSQDDE